MTKHNTFTLGYLETGLVNDDLLATHGSYPDMFSALFNSQSNQVEYRCYNIIDGQYPQDIDECDGYLITGSKSDSYDSLPWINTLKGYICQLNAKRKPMVGICFGHQIIAHALGGRAARNPAGWGVGIHNYQLTPNLDRPWFSGKQDGEKTFNLLVSHRDQVVALPDQATLLASNSFCPFAAYFIEDHVLCFQGHPEFTLQYSRALMECRRADIGNEVCAKAIESYRQSSDAGLVAQWILDFIRYSANPEKH